MHKVMIHQAEYDNCFDAIERAFELFPLDIEGKKVMVKPNTLNAAGPEEGVTTHPSVLRAVIERLEKSGPSSPFTSELRIVGKEKILRISGVLHFTPA